MSGAFRYTSLDEREHGWWSVEWMLDDDFPRVVHAPAELPPADVRRVLVAAGGVRPLPNDVPVYTFRHVRTLGGRLPVERWAPEAVARTIARAAEGGWDRYVYGAAAMWNLPASLIFAIIHRESNGIVDVVNRSSDAVGLMQLVPITRSHYRITREQALDARINIAVGVALFGHCVHATGSFMGALAAYAAGVAGSSVVWTRDIRMSVIRGLTLWSAVDRARGGG